MPTIRIEPTPPALFIAPVLLAAALDFPIDTAQALWQPLPMMAVGMILVTTVVRHCAGRTVATRPNEPGTEQPPGQHRQHVAEQDRRSVTLYYPRASARPSSVLFSALSMMICVAAARKAWTGAIKFLTLVSD